MSAENITIARPYAKAVFLVAKEDKACSEWAIFLAALKTLAISDDVKTFVNRPDISHDKQLLFLQDLASDILKRKLKEKEAHFLGLILESKRFAILPLIQEEYEMLVLADQSIVQAELISAFDVTNEEFNLFSEALKRRFQKDVKLSIRVDAKLIGGAMIKAGDWVVDGSLKGRLERISSHISQS